MDLNKLKSINLSSMQPSVQTGKYLIPENWELGIYAIRPIKNGVEGKTRLLNAPDVWWIQGDNVTFSTPGGEFSIYGKCLSYGDATVYLKNQAGNFTKAQIINQDMWHVTIDLDNFTHGNYEVFAHNGLGGEYGWVKAGDLQVKDKTQWPDKLFNVVDYGAKPNSNPNRSRLDQTNDSPAFQRALDAAGDNGGGVVYVPKGCYRLVEPLNVPRFVTIRGESDLMTNLGWVDREDPPLGFINGTNNFAVEDLTIFVQNHWSVIRGDHGHIPGAGNVAVRRVTIRAIRMLGVTPREYGNKFKEVAIEREWNHSRREAALFFGGENIEVRDCDIIASHSSIIFDKASGIVANNKLYCPVTMQSSQYWLRGCHDMIMVDNDIYGGGCLGTHNTSRGVNRKDDWECYFNAVSRNVFFARNKQQDNWKWDREMMTLDSHGYNGPYVGPVAEGKGNKLKLPEAFPVLRVGGEIMSKTGAVNSNKKLLEGKAYKIVVKMTSKTDPIDWDRCFVNYYEGGETLEVNEPKIFDRNGDSRHFAHGKVVGARIRGSKGCEIKNVRIAKSWTELRSESSSESLFSNITLNGEDIPQKDTEMLFDFDADDQLYVMVDVVANGAYATGQFELLLDNGRRALDVGIARLGGKNIDFNNIPSVNNQHSNNINVFKGAFVYVLEGKGCGQYRKIIDGKGSELTLDRPWDVVLDETSVISIHRTHDHQIFVNNEFVDGGVALQLYGGAVENIIAENTAIRAGGFIVTGLNACATMYTYLLNNKVVTGAGLGGAPFNLRGGRISVEPYRPIGYLDGYQSIGVVMRGNSFNNLTSANVAGPVQNVLIENNYFANTSTAVMVHSEGMGSFQNSWYWPQDVFIRNNKIENVDAMLEAEKEAKVKLVE